MITLSKGWKLFVKALPASRYGSVAEAAEWMYRLNVFSRSIGRHPITDQVYTLKNDFLRYLYQHGYCTEVTMHKQEFPCWGTWDEGCGDDCPKCGGTGIFRTEKLYAFRFTVNGMKYAWHQPAKLIDYEVQLTDPQITEFTPPRKDAAILSMEDAWLGCCAVWWCLALHGTRSSLLLWPATRSYWMTKTGISRTWKTFTSRIRNAITQLPSRVSIRRKSIAYSTTEERENDIPF